VAFRAWDSVLVEIWKYGVGVYYKTGGSGMNQGTQIR